MVHADLPSVLDPERRFRREWMRDGLPDIYGGPYLLMVVGIVVGLAAVPTRFGGLVLLFPVAVIAGTMAVVRAFFETKARVSDPRIGYVRPRLPRWLSSSWRSRGVVIASGALCGFVSFVGPPVAAWLHRVAPGSGVWWPLLLLAPSVVGSILSWRRYGTTRHLGIAAIGLLGAGAGVAVGLHGVASLLLAGGVQGGAHVVVGGVAPRSFLATHPLLAAG